MATIVDKIRDNTLSLIRNISEEDTRDQLKWKCKTRVANPKYLAEFSEEQKNKNKTILYFVITHILKCGKCTQKLKTLWSWIF